MLEAGDLDELERSLAVWSRGEYPRRLAAQERRRMVQVIAWDGEVPVGRGMVLFAEHEEYSVSATREGCAEVRDGRAHGPFISSTTLASDDGLVPVGSVMTYLVKGL